MAVALRQRMRRQQRRREQLRDMPHRRRRHITSHPRRLIITMRVLVGLTHLGIVPLFNLF